MVYKTTLIIIKKDLLFLSRQETSLASKWVEKFRSLEV